MKQISDELTNELKRKKFVPKKKKAGDDDRDDKNANLGMKLIIQLG